MGYCESLDTVRASNLASLFGKEKLGNWCECAYGDLNKKFTSEEVFKIVTDQTGALEEKYKEFSYSAPMKIAECIDKSTADGKTLEIKDTIVEYIRTQTEAKKALAN